MRKFREKASRNYQISLRPNREVENAYRAYETSWETERLESEGNRQIYCELIGLGLKGRVGKIDEIADNKTTNKAVDKPTDNANDDNSEEEQRVEQIGEKPRWWKKVTVESNIPRRLNEMAVETLARDYKKGRMDSMLTCQDAEDFGLLIDISLSSLELIELENETYWKRVVESKKIDVLQFQEMSRSSDVYWKKIALQLTLEELIEGLEQNRFDLIETVKFLMRTAEELQSYVENLSIKRMKPRQSSVKNLLNPKSRVVNFPSDECFHGSLEFLGSFKGLKRLEITYNPGRLQYTYERRLLQVATVDIENIAKALVKLENLEMFSLHGSDLSEAIKIRFLLEPLKSLEHLTHLSLANCKITSAESGEHFSNLLKRNSGIRHLELKGNYLDFGFCEKFASGIEAFRGELEFLGLSMNPIMNNGLKEILRGISEKDNIIHVDFSNCTLDVDVISEETLQELIKLIRSSRTIRRINFDANEIPCGQKLIEALNSNYEIDELSCENCGFAVAELVKVKVLLLRNDYYKKNPILRKNQFSEADEIEVEKFLTRVKHPLLLKYKEKFQLRSMAKKPLTFLPRKVKMTNENYSDFAYSVV